METNTISSIHYFEGKKVLGNTGNECGVIKDFFIDMESGKIRFVVVSGESNYIAPFDAVTFDNLTATQLILNTPREKLLNATSIPRKGNTEDWTSFYEKILAYYGEENQALPYTDSDQAHEGSSQITDHLPSGSNAMSGEVEYNKFKAKKDESEQ